MPTTEALEFHRLRHSYDNGGRFWVGRHELHCGDPLAIQIGFGREFYDLPTNLCGKTLRGRVEWSDDRGWYFIGEEVSFRLLEGMAAAVPAHPRMAPLGPTW